MSDSFSVKPKRKLLAFAIGSVLAGWIPGSSSNTENTEQTRQQSMPAGAAPDAETSINLDSIDQLKSLNVDEITKVVGKGKDYLIRILGQENPDGTIDFKPVVVAEDGIDDDEARAIEQAINVAINQSIEQNILQQTDQSIDIDIDVDIDIEQNILVDIDLPEPDHPEIPATDLEPAFNPEIPATEVEPAFNPDLRPPDAPWVINEGEQAEVPSNMTVTTQPTCLNGEAPCNITMNGGSLTNKGSIQGNTTAVMISAKNASEVNLLPGSTIAVQDPAAAIDASAAGSSAKVDINVHGGRVTGDIKGGPGTDTLNLHSSAKPTDDKGPADIRNHILGFDTINIHGDGWNHHGWIADGNLLTTTSAIRDLYASHEITEDTSYGKGQPETLRVATGDKAFKIATIPDHGRINNLHIYGAPKLDFSYSNNGPARVDNILVHSWEQWQVTGLFAGINNIFAVPDKGVTVPENECLIDHIFISGPGAAHAGNQSKTLHLVTHDAGPDDAEPGKYSNPHPSISAPRHGLIDAVTINDGANIGAISKVDTINVSAGSGQTRWLTSGLISDPRSIVVKDGGTIDKISLSPAGKGAAPVTNDQEMLLDFSTGYMDGKGGQEFQLTNNHGGTINMADFTGSGARPTLHFHQAGGNSGVIRGLADKQDIIEFSAGKVEDASGFARVIISGNQWQHSHITNPTSINVVNGGEAHTISDQGCTADGELLVVFTPPDEASRNYQQVPAFTVANTGGKLDQVTFSSETRPKSLIMHQQDGITGDVQGSPGLGDQLQLSGGKIGDIQGLESVTVAPGESWTAGTIHDPANIHILPGAMVKSITSSPSKGKPGESNTLNLSYNDDMTMPSKGMQQGNDTVAIQSAGDVDNLDFSDNGSPRPKLMITQSDGSIGTITGQFDDSLVVTGGTIKGDITGPGHIDFSAGGDGSHFLGDTITTTGKVRVNGKLHGGGNTLNVRSPHDKELIGQPNPTFEIAPGGSLAMPGDIVIDGTYRQFGDLYLASTDAIVDQDSVPVSAHTIDIGSQAQLAFDSTRVIDGDVLMQASVDKINRPVMINAHNEQYSHYYAALSDDGKTMVLRSEPIGDHVNRMAAQGGAPGDATTILAAAAAPKEPLPTGFSRDSRMRIPVNDPLGDFVTSRATSPKATARLARQLTPDITGSVLDATRESLKSNSKAIAARNDSMRSGMADMNGMTGMNSGDLFSSGAFWIQYAYSDAKQDRKDGVDGYKARINGVTLGMDTDLNEQTNAGIAYTYAKGDIDGRGDLANNTIDTKNHIISVYSSYTEDNMYIDGRLSYASGKNKGHRYVDTTRHNAEYDSKSWGIGLTGGYPMPLDEKWLIDPMALFNSSSPFNEVNWVWEPTVLFNYYTIETDDYSESPTDPAKQFLSYDRVSNDKYTILELGAGIKIAGELVTDSWAFKPELSLMAFHDFKDDPVTITAHLAGYPDSFVIHGASRDENRFQFAASLGMEIHENTTLTVSYSHDWMSSFKADGFQARLRYEF